MPKPPLPPEFNAYLAQPNPSVIATLDENGSPHTAATWYLWENGRVLVNMDEGRVSAWIEVDSWHAWAVGEPWSDGR